MPQALFGSLFDFRGDHFPINQGFKGFGSPLFANPDEEIDEGDLNQGRGLTAERGDDAFPDLRVGGEEIQCLGRGQPDVDARVFVERSNQRFNRRPARGSDQLAVTDAEKTLARGCLTEKRKSGRLSKVIHLGLQTPESAPEGTGPAQKDTPGDAGEEQSDLSHSALASKFMIMTGRTMKNFQAKITMCHAFHDLICSNLSIKEIAYNYQMAPNAFSWKFHRRYGITPSQLRKKRIEEMDFDIPLEFL